MAYEKQTVIVGIILEGLKKHFPGYCSASLMVVRAEQLLPAIATDAQAWALVAYLNIEAREEYLQLFWIRAEIVREHVLDPHLYQRARTAYALEEKACSHAYSLGQRCAHARRAYEILHSVYVDHFARERKKSMSIDRAERVYFRLVGQLESLGYVVEYKEDDSEMLGFARRCNYPSRAWTVVENLNSVALDFLLKTYIPKKMKWLEGNMPEGQYEHFERSLTHSLDKAENANLKGGARVNAALDVVTEIQREVERTAERKAKKLMRPQTEAARRARQLERS